MEGAVSSIYERVLLAGRTAKIYYYDGPSSTMEIVNLLRNQSKIFGTFDQFLGTASPEICRTTASSSPITTITTATVAQKSLLTSTRSPHPTRRDFHQ